MRDDADPHAERDTAVEGSTHTRSGSLPFSGAELLPLVLVAIGLIGAGALLTARRRRRHQDPLGSGAG